MANTSAPRLVEDKDLYDGPLPPPHEARLNFLPAEEKKDARSRPDYVATITAALDMLGTRILALIAVIAACVIWAFAVYDPQQQRLYAAVGFSVTVLLPLVVLYFRRG
jgi:hypothetical protein